MSIQASDLASGEVKVMTELNKILRFAKSVAQQRMKFLAKPEKNQKRNIHDLAVIMFVDAAFSVRKDPGSRGGYIILEMPKSFEVKRHLCPYWHGVRSS